MIKKLFFPLCAVALIGVFLSACHADADLGKLQGDVDVSATFSLPVGTVSTTFADMIGLLGDDVEITINEDGVLQLNLHEHHTNEFHAIDLVDYVGRVESDVLISDAMPCVPLIPAGTEQDVPFDLTIKFNGINDDMSDERIDSMLITEARFTTKITTNNLTITDADIQQVKMVLGDAFRRAGGKEIVLDGFALGKDMPVVLDNFTMNMMLDETQAPSSANVRQTADIRFVLSLKTGEDVILSPASGFHFSFSVVMMDYTALYGFFEAGNQTHDIGAVDIPFSMPGKEPLILPMRDPEIKLIFTYGLSMPIDLHFDYIRAVHPNDDYTYANWSGTQSPKLPLHSVLPVDAPLDAVVVDSSVILTKASDKGQIDKFFLKPVDSLGYAYRLRTDRQREVHGKVMDQFRLTKNHTITLDFIATLPFDFNPGLNVVYDDTIKGIDLSAASLDSLAAMTDGLVKKIDSVDLAIYLDIKNEIPVDLKFELTFLDEKNQPLELKQFDDIVIAGADMQGSTITPAERTYTIGVRTEDFEQIEKVKALCLRARLGDDVKPSRFYADRKLSVKAGLTADVQAVLDVSTYLGFTNDKK